MRHYANQTARPLWPLRWRTNFTFFKIFVSLSADLAEVGAAREQFPDVGGGQLAVSADGVRQVAADLRVV